MTDTTPPTPNATGPLPGGRWLIPIADAATILPVSERTLRTHIAAGTLPHRRIGGRVFMAWPEDFDALLGDSAA